MKFSLLAACALSIALCGFDPLHGQSEVDGVVAQGVPGDSEFIRGLCSGQTATPGLNDLTAGLSYIFSAAATPGCLDACDVNDDGAVTFLDSFTLLVTMYGGSAPPPAPFASCGVDPTADSLSCDVAPNVCE